VNCWPGRIVKSFLHAWAVLMWCASNPLFQLCTFANIRFSEAIPEGGQDWDRYSKRGHFTSNRRCAYSCASARTCAPSSWSIRLA
jgi:hypothetical protein